jgi:hypothetical protein
VGVLPVYHKVLAAYRLLSPADWRGTISYEDKSMSRNDAYIENALMKQESLQIASQRDLELQDTLLDVAAVMAATEPQPKYG